MSAARTLAAGILATLLIVLALPGAALAGWLQYPIATDATEKTQLDFAGDLIVWQSYDYTTDERKVMLHQVSTSETTELAVWAPTASFTAAAGIETIQLSTDGRYVAWVDMTATATNIYDTVTDTTTTLEMPSYWLDLVDGRLVFKAVPPPAVPTVQVADIYLYEYDIASETLKTLSTTAWDYAIAAGDGYTAWDSGERTLWLQAIGGASAAAVFDTDTRYPGHMDLDDGRLVWEQPQVYDNGYVYHPITWLHDIAAGETTQIDGGAQHEEPLTDSGYVTWKWPEPGVFGIPLWNPATETVEAVGTESLARPLDFEDGLIPFTNAGALLVGQSPEPSDRANIEVRELSLDVYDLTMNTTATLIENVQRVEARVSDGRVAAAVVPSGFQAAGVAGPSSLYLFAPNEAPTVELETMAFKLTVGEELTLTGAAFDAESELSGTLDFGDGNSEDLVLQDATATLGAGWHTFTVTHAWAEAGSYTVEVAVFETGPEPQLASTDTATVTVRHFSDVPDSEEFYEAVEALASDGVINGYEDGTYGLHDPVLRAQLAKMAVIALGLHDEPITNENDPTFPDVPFLGEAYPFDFVEEAADAEIVEGYDDGTFGPYDSLRRIHLVRVLVRALGDSLAAVPVGYVLPFEDVPAGDKDLVALAHHNGLIDGTSASTFDPWGQATRGHVAKILYNALNAR